MSTPDPTAPTPSSGLRYVYALDFTDVAIIWALSVYDREEARA